MLRSSAKQNNNHRHTADPSPLDLGCNNRQAFSPPSRPHNFPKEQADRHPSERRALPLVQEAPHAIILLAYSLRTIETEDPRVHSLISTSCIVPPIYL
jgi:hypothetical protein